MSATESHISGNMTVCLHLLVTNSNCFEPRGWRKVSKIRTDTFYTGNLFEYVVLKIKNIAIVPSKNDRHARSEGICHKKKYLKHDDVIKWKHFPRYWPFVRGIHFDLRLNFFDLRLNKRLSKQPWGWWFETLSWSLWRHRNELVSPESLGNSRAKLATWRL